MPFQLCNVENKWTVNKMIDNVVFFHILGYSKLVNLCMYVYMYHFYNLRLVGLVVLVHLNFELIKH